MKIAELFVELGFKIEGKDDLKAVETSLVNIAAAARDVVKALAQLAAAKIPKNLRRALTPQTQNQPGGGGGGTPPAGPSAFPQQPSQPPGGGGSPPAAWGQFIARVLGIGTLVLAVKKLIGVLSSLAKNAFTAAVNTELFTRQTSVGRRTLKEWELAVMKAGLNREEAANAFKTMAQKRERAFLTGEGATPFLQLFGGIPRNDEELFEQFRERTRYMTKEQAVMWGEMLGFTADFAAFLHTRRDEIDSLAGRLSTDEQQAAIVKLNAAWQELKFNIEQLAEKILGDLAPALTKIVGILNGLIGIGPKARELDPLGTRNFRPTSFAPYAASTTVTNSPTITVEVNGAASPAATGEAVVEALRREVQRAYYGRAPANLAPVPQ